MADNVAPEIDDFNPQTYFCMNTYWRGKPPTEMGRAVGEYHWKHAEATPYELMELVAKGMGFTALLGDLTHTSDSGKSTGIHRHTDNFARLDYVGVDFDDGTSIEDVLDDPLARECGSFAYATASHTLQAPRSRLVFCLEQPITDVDLAAEVVHAVVWHFREERPDDGAKGAVRIWYGTKRGNPVRWIGGRLWQDEVNRLLQEFRASPDYRAPSEAAMGFLASLVPSSEPPVLSIYGLKPETLDYIHDPVTTKNDPRQVPSKQGRSHADSDIIRDLWKSNASWQTILDVYSYFLCGQHPDSKFQERGLPYLEQHIAGVMEWRTKWTNDDAIAWESLQHATDGLVDDQTPEPFDGDPNAPLQNPTGATPAPYPTQQPTPAGRLHGFIYANGDGYRRLSFDNLLTRLKKRSQNEYSEQFIAGCAEEGQLGDAKLLTKCAGDVICYFQPDQQYFYFDGVSHKEVAESTIVNFTSELLRPLYGRYSIDLYAQEVAELHAGNEDAAKKLKAERENVNRRANALTSSATVRKVLDFTKSDLLMGRNDDSAKWDSNVELLGVENGIISLVTGQMVVPCPSQLIRTCAPVRFDSRADAPLFKKSVLEVLSDCEETVGYVQRLLGYAASGTAQEAIFPVFYGEHGRNGKEFLMERIRNVLGDKLAGTAEAELLLSNRHARAANSSTEAVMTLRGRRIAWVSETNEGRDLDLAKMKDLSGGHILTGRHNHGSQQEWKRTHTPFMITNHKPHVRSQGLAEWSRIRLIEFKRSFVAEPDPAKPYQHKADPTLGSRIDHDEAPGVLNWIIAGCLEWRKGGLQEPQSVKDATKEYQEAEDTLGQFIDECCIVGDGKEAERSLLYDTYKNWMIGIAKPMGKTTFYDKVEKRGYSVKAINGKRCFNGIGIVREFMTAESQRQEAKQAAEDAV